MRRLPQAVICLLVLLGFSEISAHDAKFFILAARRTGVVELIDPETLATAARIHFDLAPGNSGLNGVSASADGSTLYVQGAVPPNPSCCGLYTVDLATMKTVATTLEEKYSKPSPLIFSDGLVYFAAKLLPGGPTHDFTIASRNARFLLSPDGRWLFGIRSFRGPALETFDLKNGSAFRELTPPGPADNSGTNGADGVWSGDHFYFYAANGTKGGRLWTVSPGAEQLGPGVEVAEFGDVPGCRERAPVVKAIAAAGANLFVYEPFGGKSDRTHGCVTLVPGGAWIVDAATGKLTRQIAPEFHLSRLIADRSGRELYGLAENGGPAQLVRIDARDGTVLKSRNLDPGIYTLSTAALRLPPAGDVHIIPRAE